MYSIAGIILYKYDRECVAFSIIMHLYKYNNIIIQMHNYGKCNTFSIIYPLSKTCILYVCLIMDVWWLMSLGKNVLTTYVSYQNSGH